MKKAALIIAAILLAAGLIVGFVALASAKFDFRMLETASTEMRSYPVEGSFRSIEILEDTAEIRFERSDNGTAHVLCRETKKSTHTVTTEDGVLKIAAKQTSGWKKLIDISFEKELVVVYLPEEAYETLSIDIHTGDVTVPEWLSFNGAAINGATGDVRYLAPVSGTLSIRTETGDVSAEGVSAAEIECRTTTGHILLQNVSCKGDVSANVSTGKVILNGLTCRNFKTEGSSGDVALRNVLASGTVSIERSTGDVHFDGSDAGGISVKTSTGDVTGTLRTDKIFVTNTSTGNVHVPASVAGGKCEITTTTGDIGIGIVPEA